MGSDSLQALSKRTVVEAMAGIEGSVVVGHSVGGATILLVPGRTRVGCLASLAPPEERQA